MDAFADVSTPTTDELHCAVLLASRALFDDHGRVCVPRDTELELRAEIGRLTAQIRKAEAEARP